MIQTKDFTKWFGVLLAEAFGVSDPAANTFVDVGLLGTVNTVSAATASAVPKPGAETIAAHCAHVLYIFRLFDAYEQGQTPEPDWPGSWQTQVVDEAAWATLRAELKTAYDTVVARLQTREVWPEAPVAAAMILLAHCAYHVGEVRQLLTVVTP